MRPIDYQDLASATIRSGRFGGRAPDAIHAEMPILPLNAPGLPPPGPTFVAFAQALGDAEPAPPPGKKPTRTTKKKQVVRANGPQLTALTRAALYFAATEIPTEFNGQREPIIYWPGMLKASFSGDHVLGPGVCRLVVLGKCLGRTEATTGEPYSGMGSKPLWEAWDSAGLPRPGAALPTFLTNLVRFEPPAAAQARLPREWIADGLHLVYQELIACRPEVLLVLGADALKALFGPRARIADYIGRATTLTIDCRPTVESAEELHTIRVVAVEHPAAVARDPDKQPALNAGLKQVARLLGLDRAADAIARIAIDHRPIFTIEELVREVDASIAASTDGGYIAFDCEWEGRHPTDAGAYLYTMQWSHAPGHARIVFFRGQHGANNPAMPLDQAVEHLRRLMVATDRRGARLVGHFAKADLPWLASIGVDLYQDYVGAADDPAPDGTTRLYGWQKTYYTGAFDTFVAAHAVDENEPRKLEVIAAYRIGTERYDAPIAAFITAYCKDNKIRRSALNGYGCVPEEILTPYGCYDADVAGRLYLHYNGNPREGTFGLVDSDRFKQSSRQIFGIRMRAWAAWAEMERYGIEVDRETHRMQRDQILSRRAELLSEFRAAIGWDEDPNDPAREAFDPARRRHRIEFLFGESFSPNATQIRPPGALSLYLTPHKSTKTYGNKLWADALLRAATTGGTFPAPAADKETLIHLARSHTLVAQLRDIDFLTTATKVLFRPPDEVLETEDDSEEQDPNDEVYEKGFLHYLNGDGRIRSTFGYTETGRATSSRVNLQNLSDAVDEQYDRILQQGKDTPATAAEDDPRRKRAFGSRAILKARDGWYLVGADLKIAEIFAAALSSNDPLLIDHARRASLPESDPNWLDLHSDLAMRTFALTCSLKEVKSKHKPLRTAAKRTRFGHYYGAGAETILRKALEDGANVTLEQIEEILRGHDEAYPTLAGYFAMCRARVKAGWACNGYGGRRRFRTTTERDLLAAMEREMQNWSCQGLVADNISLALGNMWTERNRRKMRTRIVLSMHDSALLEAPAEEVKESIELLDVAMVQQAPIVVTALDGTPLPRGPYRFSIDVSVYRNWGVEIDEDERKKLGIGP